jgi:hypothetical protein
VTDALARKAHRRLIVASDELRIGGDAAVDGGERVAGAQPLRTTGSLGAFLPAPNVSEHQAIIAVRQREIRIEAQRL